MDKKNILFNLPFSIFKEGKHFIAYSPVLDLSTSGKDYEEIRRRFYEVVQIFFEELIKKGTLKEVLTSLGWQKTRQRWQPPVLIAQDYVPISPYSLEKV
ncbi:MAG: hypothetical protein AB1630_12740 [bacterium]